MMISSDNDMSGLDTREASREIEDVVHGARAAMLGFWNEVREFADRELMRWERYEEEMP